MKHSLQVIHWLLYSMICVLLKLITTQHTCLLYFLDIQLSFLIKYFQTSLSQRCVNFVYFNSILSHTIKQPTIYWWWFCIPTTPSSFIYPLYAKWYIRPHYSATNQLCWTRQMYTFLQVLSPALSVFLSAVILHVALDPCTDSYISLLPMLHIAVPGHCLL